jgi:hypothetical protein
LLVAREGSNIVMEGAAKTRSALEEWIPAFTGMTDKRAQASYPPPAARTRSRKDRRGAKSQSSEMLKS